MKKQIVIGSLTKGEVQTLSEKLMEIATIDPVMLKSMTTANFAVDLDSVTVILDVMGEKEKTVINSVTSNVATSDESIAKRKLSAEEQSLCDRIRGHVNSLLLHGTTREIVAKKIGINPNSLTSWMTGKNRPSRSMDVVQKLFELKPEPGKLGIAPNYCELGKKITSFCQDNKLSRKDFADMHEVSIYDLNGILEGKKMSERIMGEIEKTLSKK